MASSQPQGAPPRAPQPEPIVVGIAASAGGLRALIELFGSLPADFEAPIVVVQHLDPSHPSFMAQILDRRTSLEVQAARDGDRLESGVVLLAPPDHHIVVDAGRGVALPRTERIRHLRPSADVLFFSIAENYGPRGIAVILTGTGSDGSRGATEVSKRGGTVLAQDEDSSEFTGMPSSVIATGCVDRVLPLPEIPSALTDLVKEVAAR